MSNSGAVSFEVFILTFRCGELEYAPATGNDYPAHEQTCRSFVTLVALIVILMAYFLT
jgi:Bacterial aa3 type cytochrome c oxidase subunit IV